MIRPLARGGMGQVYLVEHRELGRECVAKLVHEALAGQPQLIDRVRIEAEALGTLNHPNIVSVNNFGTTTDGRPFIVMEYLRGRDLGRELVSGRVFALSDSIRIALEAAAALSAAHSMGIIHRDIKPENLLLHEESDGHVTLKVLDFGVARIIPGVAPNAPTPLAQPTNTGVIIGTLRYVSPEGAAGIRADARADIYSLGLVLYRMLAGRGPFSDNLKNGDLITACLTEAPKPPSRYARVPIPPELDKIVLKALRKDPDERFQSAREFGDALTFVQRTLAESTHDSEAVAFALGPTILSPIYAGSGTNQDESASNAPALPAKDRMENDERTVLAVGKNSRSRVSVANAILFAVVMLATAVLVAISVFKLRQGMGTP